MKMPALLRFASAIIFFGTVARLPAAEPAWQWRGTFGDSAIELLILGDIQVRSEGRKDPRSAFAHVANTLNRADLVYANLAGMLVESQGIGKDIPDKPWVHLGRRGVVALTFANIDAVGVANNVAYGRDNIMETLRVLDQEKIGHVGAGKNLAEAHRPLIVERKGVKVGFLQYTARWYREDQQLATASLPGVARLTLRDGVRIDPDDLDRVRNDIRRLRSEVDFVVVSHHNRDGATRVQFGQPANPRPDGTEQYQKEFAHLAIDTGADFVFGHGTHKLQGVEIYRGKPVFYTIGHSVFDQPGYDWAKHGLVIRVVIEKGALVHTSFVPVTRDDDGDLLMQDPSKCEGAEQLQIIRSQSNKTPLPIERQEVVLLGRSAAATAE